MKGNGPRKLDRKALKQIKANLGLINHRYNGTERRILEHFARDEAATEVRLPATPVLFSPTTLSDGAPMVKPPHCSRRRTRQDNHAPQSGAQQLPHPGTNAQLSMKRESK